MNTQSISQRLAVPRLPEAEYLTEDEIAERTKVDIEEALKGIEIMSNQVLVATFIRAEKTAGGIIRPEKNRREDVFQGKVGLVLKVGPMAFKDDDKVKFYGQKVEDGDWVVYRASDGWKLQIVSGGKKIDAHLLEDTEIKAKVAKPGLIW